MGAVLNTERYLATTVEHLSGNICRKSHEWGALFAKGLVEGILEFQLE